MPHFNHFDFLATLFDRSIGTAVLERFKSLAGLPSSGLLLDAGGGTGRKSYPLMKMVSGIVIADSSMGMLSKAVKKVGLITTCSETEHLPFDNDTFERVMMVDALHHVSDYKVTAAELWRVLKPGGRIVIEEPDIRTLAVKIVAIVEKLILMRSHFIDPGKIASIFNYPNSMVKIETEGPVAWILIDKLT